MTTQSRRSVVAIATLALLTLLSPFVTSTASAQGLERVGTLTVFDSTGKRVGRVISIPVATLESVVVTFKVDGQLVALQVDRNRFKTHDLVELWFETLDCSGTPFLRDGRLNTRILPAAAVSVPGSTVYLADPKATPQTITGGSRLLEDGTCSTSQGFTGPAIQAIPLIDLDTAFIPPFSVRGRSLR